MRAFIRSTVIAERLITLHLFGSARRRSGRGKALAAAR
jgi:hypothetical protein